MKQLKRVLIDLTQIPLERTGVGIYAFHYVRQLREQQFDCELHLLAQDDDAELLHEARAIPRTRVITVKAALFRRFALRVLLEQLLIPALALWRSVDAVHSLHYSFPLLSFGRFRRIVTVCDMGFYVFPQLHVPVKRLYFRFFIRRLPRVDGLLFISAATMRDFDARFPRGSARREVMPLGVDLARLQQEANAVLSNRLKQRLGIDRYILYVGTIEPRKNVLGLIRAFERCADAFPDVKLVIAGKLGWDYRDVLDHVHVSPVRSRIVLAGYVNEAEKHALLKAAQVFAYVSFYEGFGLPVLEGMAAGTATVTSRLSAMPEVAGDGALLVDPYDIDAIASAIAGLLADEAARRRLIARGLAQSRNFTWQQTAMRSLDFYRQVLAPAQAEPCLRS